VAARAIDQPAERAQRRLQAAQLPRLVAWVGLGIGVVVHGDVLGPGHGPTRRLPEGSAGGEKNGHATLVSCQRGVEKVEAREKYRQEGFCFNAATLGMRGDTAAAHLTAHAPTILFAAAAKS
jgi:hypothetical protein